MFDSMLRPVTLPASLLGAPSPCDLFNAQGTLLLRSGAPIPPHVGASRHRSRLFCQPSHADRITCDDPVGALHTLAAQLSELAERIEYRRANSARGFVALADALLTLWSQDADFCLGYVRRVRLQRPSVHHALHTALLAAELGAANGTPHGAVRTLVGAALSMNVGSMILHDELAELAGEPDAATREDILAHPGEAARLLDKFGGVPDEWIATVFESHECVDGSGYPLGLRRAEITLPARMLRIADALAARLDGCRARPAQTWLIHQARDARRLARHVFGDELEQLDQTLVRLLITRLGGFPPGTLVRLSNGEVAVAPRRDGHGNWQPQVVLSIIGAHGRPLEAPRTRRIGARDLKVLGYADAQPSALERLDWANVWGYRRRNSG